MIRTLFTLTIGAAIGAAFARQNHAIAQLREELYEQSLALDDAEGEREAALAAFRAMVADAMRRTDSVQWPTELDN